MRQKRSSKVALVGEAITEMEILTLAAEALAQSEKITVATRILADKLRTGYPEMDNVLGVARAVLRRLSEARAAREKNQTVLPLEGPFPVHSNDRLCSGLRPRKRPIPRQPVLFANIEDSVVKLRGDAKAMVNALDEQGAFEALMSAAQLRHADVVLTPEIFVRHIYRPERN